MAYSPPPAGFAPCDKCKEGYLLPFLRYELDKSIARFVYKVYYKCSV
ncbi:MAG: hypothetical protein HYU39_05425 [Thaumarchaeota archaeon]|nr:hypothetical protein [Nitrososphaerota archaeon]